MIQAKKFGEWVDERKAAIKDAILGPIKTATTVVGYVRVGIAGEVDQRAGGSHPAPARQRPPAAHAVAGRARAPAGTGGVRHLPQLHAPARKSVG
ncbi:hypothetical protein G6F23_015522 [Rhizopus arrhizus]|nr:hypothetical protein G6F23_015522 [Rhizopus arrhizus]